jgi:hypothetical protein
MILLDRWLDALVVALVGVTLLLIFAAMNPVFPLS